MNFCSLIRGKKLFISNKSYTVEELEQNGACVDEQPRGNSAPSTSSIRHLKRAFSFSNIIEKSRKQEIEEQIPTIEKSTAVEENKTKNTAAKTTTTPAKTTTTPDKTTTTPDKTTTTSAKMNISKRPMKTNTQSTREKTSGLRSGSTSSGTV